MMSLDHEMPMIDGWLALAGLAGGIFNMFTQAGTSVGLAINTIIQAKLTQREVEALGGVYDPNSHDIPSTAVEKGLRGAFFGCAGFAFVALLIAVVLLRGIGKVGERRAVVVERKSETQGEAVMDEAVIIEMTEEDVSLAYPWSLSLASSTDFDQFLQGHPLKS